MATALLAAVLAFYWHQLFPTEVTTDRPIVLVSGDIDTEQMSHAIETLSHFRNLYTLHSAPSSGDNATYQINFESARHDGSFVGQLFHLSSGQIISASRLIGPGSDNLSQMDNWLANISQLNGVIEKDYMRRGEYSAVFHCRHLTEIYFGHQTDETHLAARNCLQDMIANGEESPTLHANLAMILREEHSDQRNLLPGDPLYRAMQAARTAIEKDPFDANNHYALMTVLFMMGSTSEAITAGNRAVKLAPLDGNILGGYASRLITVARYTEALEMFERSIEINPGQLHWRHYGMFNAHIALGDRASAAEISLTLDGSENPLYLAATAIGLNILGRTDEAQKKYELLLSHEPDVREMYERRNYDTGLVHALMEEIGQLEGARQQQ